MILLEVDGALALTLQMTGSECPKDQLLEKDYLLFKIMTFCSDLGVEQGHWLLGCDLGPGLGSRSVWPLGFMNPETPGGPDLEIHRSHPQNHPVSQNQTMSCYTRKNSHSYLIQRLL